jgi:hypothetical protein
MVVTLNIVDQHLLEIAAADELARLRRYQEAWEAYHGDSPEPLKPIKGQVGDGVIVNYARMVVDKGVSFLFGQDVKFELDESGQTPEENWLAECWTANGGMTTLQKMALNGGVCGHAFAKLVPTSGRPYPRIIVLDPANVAVGYDPGDIDEVLWYRIQYAGLDAQGEMVTYRQLIERDGGTWQITDQMSRGGSGWRTARTERWPYAWPPVVDCQNLPLPNEYYGLSDLPEDMLRLNHSINFVLSNLARIIRFHAHPKTWGKGFSADTLQIAIDETIVLPNEHSELHNLEMVSDLSSSIALFERLREALHEVTRVPEVATGKLENVGALSGVALQILYQPLIEKTETKRRTYGALLVELNRRLLALGGYGEEHRGVIHWPEMLPGDPLVERQTALIDQQLGASSDTLLQQLGYDPDMEREKRAVEQQQLGDEMLSAFDRDDGGEE